MTNTNPEAGYAPSKNALLAGWVIGVLIILFLLFDSTIKLARLDAAVEGTVALGYPVGVVFGLGLTLLVCTVLYAVPRTAILGAILLTGYLGGAKSGSPEITGYL